MEPEEPGAMMVNDDDAVGFVLRGGLKELCHGRLSPPQLAFKTDVERKNLPDVWSDERGNRFFLGATKAQKAFEPFDVFFKSPSVARQQSA
jgi:hypothetical protein